MDPLVAHQRAQDAFAGVLANVGPEQLGAATPCSEWTIQDLIEHVIGGNEHVGIWSG
ncbi:MAG TPA: maleylpyruvate isomerase N-terminal domain-containing protein, partial [Mycobacterium sp.]|nr:maleylpyruvate isomerase N-terminal domain-containing protein [Mycobacterium sp.]